MGLLSMLITVCIIVFSAGYYFFSMAPKEISFTNQTEAPLTADIAKSTEIIQTARDAKNLLETKTEESIKKQDAEDTDTGIVKKENVSSKSNDASLIIKERLMQNGFAVPKSARKIDTIVIHSSYDLNGSDPYSVNGIVKEYEDYGVSAHYLIDRKGTIYRLVADANIAYHAGVSKTPDGRKNVNDFSLGIEMMNTERGSFTSEQYSAVNALIASLKKQYKIKFVVGHNDIAPDRKTDPWNFDWKQLK